MEVVMCFSVFIAIASLGSPFKFRQTGYITPVHSIHPIAMANGDSVVFERMFTEDKNIQYNRKLLYIPGLDGGSDYAFNAFKSISNDFEVWRMKISPNDRSTIAFLGAKVDLFLKAESVDREFTLLGESFGGLLTAYVATRSKQYISNIVLVNPATSYDITSWRNVGALITHTGPAYAGIGTAAIALTALEPYQVQLYAKSVFDRIRSGQSSLEELGNLRSIPDKIAALIPPATLRWRLKAWLQAGVHLMNDKYQDITTPTLVLIGSKDRMLPSDTEGYRLLSRMTGALVDLQEFPDNGHVMLDGSQNISQIFKNSKIFQSRPSPKPSVQDYYPSPEAIAEAHRQIDPINQAASPVFLTRTGRRSASVVTGIDTIPTGRSGRPVLFVGNHQLFGADLPLLLSKFLFEKEVMIRGLAHPFIFQERPTPTATLPSTANQGLLAEVLTTMTTVREFLVKYGAVEVSPSSLLDLMRMNATMLLFPGGSKEAFHGKGEEYKLFWPERTDFVRLAAIYKALIVPFSAIGVADSFDIVLDPEELTMLPLLGEQFRRYNQRIPTVRPGVSENFLPPLARPKLSSRNYFLFHEPYDTAHLNIYDKKQCRTVYEDIRGDVSDGIDYLLKFRGKDPYRDFIPRRTYELIAGTQAPTAPINLFQ